MATEPPELLLPDAAAWRSWLAEHGDEDAAVWLVLAKKGTSDPTSLRYDEALEEALCHGWIDGQGRRRDGATSLQRFSGVAGAVREQQHSDGCSGTALQVRRVSLACSRSPAVAPQAVASAEPRQGGVAGVSI